MLAVEQEGDMMLELFLVWRLQRQLENSLMHQDIPARLGVTIGAALSCCSENAEDSLGRGSRSSKIPLVRETPGMAAPSQVVICRQRASD